LLPTATAFSHAGCSAALRPSATRWHAGNLGTPNLSTRCWAAQRQHHSRPARPCAPHLQVWRPWRVTAFGPLLKQLGRQADTPGRSLICELVALLVIGVVGEGQVEGNAEEDLPSRDGLESRGAATCKTIEKRADYHTLNIALDKRVHWPGRITAFAARCSPNHRPCFSC